MSVVDDIKERLDIVEIISAYVPLKKTGRNYKGLCPFHQEKTPSFVVFPDSGTWHCFGACGTGGDIFTFIQKRENMDFSEALRLLAQRAGVSLTPPSAEAEAESQQRDRLRKINAVAAAYYHGLLLESEEARHARDYLERRGLSLETIKAFQLGYSRGEWRALGDHLTNRGYTWDDLLAAGLVISREGGGYYDRFRGRLMFPICDIRGHVIGFAARALDDSLPKYLNSPETPLFHKGSVLYGIDRAKDAIREANLAVIVEGYMDVLMAHQYGMRNVVAQMGTALTEQQIQVLKKLTKRLALALDADAAGDLATIRGVEVAKEAFDQEVVPVPTARGLIRYEGRLEAEILVITLPKGRDPDEVIHENPRAWQLLVDQALPVMDYYFQAMTSDLDTSTARGKAEAAARLLPAIAEIVDPVMQTHYLQQLARLVKVDEKTLRTQMRGSKRPGVPRAPVKRRGRLSAVPGVLRGLEKYFLQLLLYNSTSLKRADEALTKLGLPPIDEDDFLAVEYRVILTTIRQLAAGGEVKVSAIGEALPEPLRSVLDELLSTLEPLTQLDDETLEAAVTDCTLRLREERLKRQGKNLRFLIEDARAERNYEARREWGQQVNKVNEQLRCLQRAMDARTIFSRRRNSEGPWAVR
ncbi:MAG: DNA primase [Chloroflexi bacterium]|nr:DNA primase [Chloroflexota bacterium]